MKGRKNDKSNRKYRGFPSFVEGLPAWITNLSPILEHFDCATKGEIAMAESNPTRKEVLYDAPTVSKDTVTGTPRVGEMR